MKNEDISDVEDLEDGLDEASAAADTLKANSKPGGSDPKSRIGYMKSLIGKMASMETHDLEKWHNDSIAQIGHEADKVGNVSGKNKASISAKPSAAVSKGVKEDLENLFGADETLTEEFKDTMSTLFEAAVTSRVIIETEEIKEEYDGYAEEVSAEVIQALEEQLTSYLEYCTEEFMKENEIAIESTLKSQLTDEFIEGLRDLFSEHFIDIPDEKVDLVEELSGKIEELESELHALVESNSELKGITVESELDDIFDLTSEGLTEMQKEKFATLVEGIEYEDLEMFASKLAVIKEHNFPTTTNSEDNLDEINEDNDFEGNTSTKYVDPTVKAYADALGHTIKK